MITNCFAQAQNVICRRIGDDVVVVKDDGLSTHVLNKTAAFIWEMCDGERELDEIATHLCERFEVSFEEARADAGEIIELLTQVGIINQIKGKAGEAG